MKKKILLILVLPIFLLAIFAGGALAAKKISTSPEKASVLYPAVDGGDTRLPYSGGPTPLIYEGGKGADCFDIHPDAGVVVLEHNQWGATWYDEQQKGSMGRMIAVTSGEQREATFMNLPVPPYDAEHFRWVSYNCKNALGSWCGVKDISGGEGGNAGYSNIAAMHDGREAIIYHATGLGASTLLQTALAIGDPGYVCSGDNHFVLQYDIPDALGGTEEGMWPKIGIVYDASTDTEYMHIVMTEGKTSGGDQKLGYVRCHLIAGDNLLCETPTGQPGVVSPIIVFPNIQLIPNPQVAYFGEVPGLLDQYPNTISVIFVSSPVSGKMAIVFTNKRESGTVQVNNDVFYTESDNNGNEWFPQYGGTWPPTLANGMLHNVTNYPPASKERAYTDVGACYDYNEQLHIVWNATYYDPGGGLTSADANLYHWSQATGVSVVAPGFWSGTGPGGWNRNVSKMSISALDPIYNPVGNPDSVYLFCTWTQFNGDNRDTLDNSLDGYTNGEIYGSVSDNAGRTWTPGYDLTGTHTDDCDGDSSKCLSEHWSSLAQNMYDGDLHIEYVCDKGAGGVVQETSTPWTLNPIMYMHIQQLPWYEQCGEDYINMYPANWTTPPIKVSPTSPRVIGFTVRGIYNQGGSYAVRSDDPNVVVSTNPSGYLAPGESKPVEITIYCPGDTLLWTNITIKTCVGTAVEDSIKIPLIVVCGDDYYECVRDPATKFGTKNGTMGAPFCSLWTCANGQEKLWDMRLPVDSNQIIFSAGVIAAFMDDSAIVGRQDYRDTRTGARDTIRTIKGYLYAEPDCDVQKIFVTKTYVWYPPEIPQTPKWYWININKQILLFYNRPGYTCPAWKKEQVIKHVWINYSQAPAWWPNEGLYTGHPDIYYGVYADLDAPFDTGCRTMGGESQSGCNAAGWDNVNQIVYQSGFGGVNHPEYANYYVGMALTNAAGQIVTPLGCKDVRNAEYLYPQDGWGWQDSQLYRLAATPLDEGTVVDNPDSVVDRSVVMTAGMIPAGTTTTFQGEFILIESFSRTSLDELKTNIGKARTILIPQLNSAGVFSKTFPICGDINGDGVVNTADANYLYQYLNQGGPPPLWPMFRADVNNDGVVNMADYVTLVSYLSYGQTLECSGGIPAPPPALMPPYDFNATSDNQGIYLTWNNPQTYDVLYLYCQTDTLILLEVLPGTQTSYSYKPTTSGVYCYFLKAEKGGMTTEYSDPACASFTTGSFMGQPSAITLTDSSLKELFHIVHCYIPGGYTPNSYPPQSYIPHSYEPGHYHPPIPGECNPGFHWEDDVCWQDCASGYFWDSDDNLCRQNCLSGEFWDADDNMCRENCDPGYFWDNDDDPCKEECDPGFFWDADDNLCRQNCAPGYEWIPPSNECCKFAESGEDLEDWYAQTEMTSGWDFGNPTYEPGNLYSGWGTNLEDQYYQDNVCPPALIGAIVKVPNPQPVGGTRIYVKHWYRTADTNDRLVVLARDRAGGADTTLYPTEDGLGFCGYHSGTGNNSCGNNRPGFAEGLGMFCWSRFNIPPQFNGKKIDLKFILGSDASGHQGPGGTSTGWFINKAIYIGTELHRGDCNCDGAVDAADVVYLINYLYIHGPKPYVLGERGSAGDVNCDGQMDASDVVYLINYLYIQGPPPPCPP